MRRQTMLFALALVLFHGWSPALVACQGWTPPPAVTIAGQVTDRASPALLAVEEAIANAMIDAGQDPKPMMDRWDVFWTAWRVWVHAQHAWANAYERRDTNVNQLEAAAVVAFCAAILLLPKEAPKELVSGVGFACAPQDGGIDGK